jgi:hypothetical protein
LQNLRPALLDPAVDGRLVALGGAALGLLDTRAQPVTQQRPDMGRMMLDSGQPLDDQRDPLQRPQLPDEPVGANAFQQGLLDGGELGVRQPWRRAARSAAAQSIGAVLLPAGIPDADGLSRDLKLAGNSA